MKGDLLAALKKYQYVVEGFPGGEAAKDAEASIRSLSAQTNQPDS
jgi:hypothetical protein